MKIAIIYSTKNSSTKKSCKILAKKLNAEVERIPIEMAKAECILKYDFIILAGSAIHKVQNDLKIYISRNIKTLKGKPHALILNGENSKEIFNKTFTEELVNTSYIFSNFGYELNPNEGNYIEKRKTKKLIEKYDKENKALPSLKLDKIDEFADKINNLIDKRVG